VLLVIDKQRWYLDPRVSPFFTDTDAVRMTSEVQAHDRFIDSARAADVPVVWSVMTEGDHHAPPNVLARWDRRPSEPRLRRGDAGFDFAGIGPSESEPVFEKVYPNAFSAAELGSHIRRLGRSTVVLIGSYAGRCVLATAFGAQDAGLHVVVPVGLAEPHPDQDHEEKVFNAVIDSVVGYVVEPAELLARWDGR